jgi:hypothetical protein
MSPTEAPWRYIFLKTMIAIRAIFVWLFLFHFPLLPLFIFTVISLLLDSAQHWTCDFHDCWTNTDIRSERIRNTCYEFVRVIFVITGSGNMAAARLLVKPYILLLAGEPSAVNKRVLQPRVVVLRTERKNEICERHVNQLLVRGEHVVLISVLDS